MRQKARLHGQSEVALKYDGVPGLLDRTAFNDEDGAGRSVVGGLLELSDLLAHAVKLGERQSADGGLVEDDDEDSQGLEEAPRPLLDRLSRLVGHPGLLVKNPQLHQLKHLLDRQSFLAETIFL